MSTDEVARLAGLTTADVEAALAELLRAQDRAYYALILAMAPSGRRCGRREGAPAGTAPVVPPLERE